MSSQCHRLPSLRSPLTGSSRPSARLSLAHPVPPLACVPGAHGSRRRVSAGSESATQEEKRNVVRGAQGSSRLLETGVNTLQSTLLRKRVEVDELSAQLRDKRQQVDGRMKIVRERQAQLQQRQTEMCKLKAATFASLVESNEVNRRRALKRFERDRQLNELKEQEIAQLSTQLQELQQRRLWLKEQVNKHKIFEEFLRKTLELLPDNYLGFRTFIRRYKTLSLSREDLLQKLNSLTDQMKTGQIRLDALRQQHSTYKLMANQELSELQAELFQTREKNKQLERTLPKTMGQSREQMVERASMLLAVRNMGEQCYLSHYGRLDSLDTPSVMDMIKEFMLDKADLVRRATRLIDSSAVTVKKRPSGGVQLKSPSGGVQLKSPSGGVQLKSPSGGVQLKSPSGGVQLKSPSGGVQLKSTSGGVQLKSPSGGVQLKSPSGGVQLKSTSGGVQLKSPSGGVQLKSPSGGVQLKSPSGGVQLKSRSRATGMKTPQ